MNKFSARECQIIFSVIGLLSFIVLTVVVLSIRWEWNLFMDDIGYNTWMPRVTNIWAALRDEIKTYWYLGRFYPVKYLANLLKWTYLPNDPTTFRIFNLFVFSAAIGFAALSFRTTWLVFLGLFGSAVLFKPILEIISLNPLGETWVIFFIGLGVFLESRKSLWVSVGLARVSFLLAILSKEPAAVLFFALGCKDLLLAWITPKKRLNYSLAAFDLAIFVIFFGISIYAMKQGVFTQQAYFSEIPIFRYIKDFLYSQARGAFWTAPILAMIGLALIFYKKRFTKIFSLDELGSALFYFIFAYGYLGFMSTQGIVAYQQAPGFFGLFLLSSLLLTAFFRDASWQPIKGKFVVGLILLYVFSLSVTIARWKRFVRGFVEPSHIIQSALVLLPKSTVFVPMGEVSGHIRTIIKEKNLPITLYEINDKLEENLKNTSGEVVLFEFPVYMGKLPEDVKQQFLKHVRAWKNTTTGRTYKIYIGSI